MLFAIEWQYVWRHRACFPSAPVVGAVPFVVGGKLYIVGGSTAFTNGNAVADVWEYDPDLDLWTQKSNYPLVITGGSAFVINDTAYVGFGSSIVAGQPYYSSFYFYDQAGDQWVPIASFPGTARYASMSFTIQGQGYIVSGKSVGWCQDAWTYTPATNSWTQIADFPGNGRQLGIGVASGNLGYVGLGQGTVNSVYTFYSDIYQYNPQTNIWTQIADFAPGRSRVAYFVINDTMYIAGGTDSVYNTDCWRYDVINNLWNEEQGFGCIAPGQQADEASTLNGHGYFLGAQLSNLLEFGPLDTAFTEQVNVLGGDTTYCNSFARQLTVSDSCAIWSSGEIGSSISINTPGTYWVRINDSCGVSSDTIVIRQSALPIADSIQNASCGTDNGAVGIIVLGGTPPFGYSWSNGDTTATISNLVAGSYAVTVSDFNGCSSTATAIVDTSNTANIAIVSISNDTLSSSNGQSYQWFFDNSIISGAVSSFYVAQTPGYYAVAVTDSNGCVAESNEIKFLTTGISSIRPGDAISIYPNPLNQGDWTLDVPANLVGSKMEIFDGKGSLVAGYSVDAIKTNMDVSLDAGVYVMRIISGNNIYIRKLIKL